MVPFQAFFLHAYVVHVHCYSSSVDHFEFLDHSWSSEAYYFFINQWPLYFHLSHLPRTSCSVSVLCCQSNSRGMIDRWRYWLWLRVGSRLYTGIFVFPRYKWMNLSMLKFSLLHDLSIPYLWRMVPNIVGNLVVMI